MIADKLNYREYLAKVFRAKFKELGLSQYRFVKNTPEANPQTIFRILKGKNATTCDKLAIYADACGLELVLRDKETKQVYENNCKQK